jgi:hypothetical protein
MGASTGIRVRALRFFILLFLPAPAFCAGPGTSAAAFLNLGLGARALSMAEAFVAVADDASGPHYNPSGLAFPATPLSLQPQRPYECLVSHSLQVQGVSLSQAAFARRPFALSVTHLGMGGIERRASETDAPEGSFGASDLSVGLSAAGSFGGLGLGATAKFIRQSIGELSASAAALDLGAMKRFERVPIRVGAAVANLGTKVRFIDEGYPLPRAVKVGAAYGMTRSFPHALSLELDMPRDDGISLRAGFEYLGFGPFALRGGYRTYSGAQRDAILGKALGSQASGLSEFYGLFMGAGFRSSIGEFDYAIMPCGELGTAHRFSLSMRFGPIPTGGSNR